MWVCLHIIINIIKYPHKSFINVTFFNIKKVWNRHYQIKFDAEFAVWMVTNSLVKRQPGWNRRRGGGKREILRERIHTLEPWNMKHISEMIKWQELEEYKNLYGFTAGKGYGDKGWAMKNYCFKIMSWNPAQVSRDFWAELAMGSLVYWS